MILSEIKEYVERWMESKATDLKQQQEELWERLGEILDRLSMIR